MLLSYEESMLTCLFSANKEGFQNVYALTNPKQVILINDNYMEVLADMGASVNDISQAVYDHLKNKPALWSTNLKIYPYGSVTALPLSDRFQSELL